MNREEIIKEREKEKDNLETFLEKKKLNRKGVAEVMKENYDIFLTELGFMNYCIEVAKDFASRRDVERAGNLLKVARIQKSFAFKSMAKTMNLFKGDYSLVLREYITDKYNQGVNSVQTIKTELKLNEK